MPLYNCNYYSNINACEPAFRKLVKYDTLFSLTYDWNSIWEKHYGLNNKTRVLEFTNQHQTVAILPLVAEYRRFKGIIPWTVLRFYGMPFSDWNDMLLVNEQVNFEIILREIYSTGASEIILQNLHEESAFLNYLQNLQPATHQIKVQSPCYYIDTTGNYNNWLKQNTSKQFVQQDIRRLFRKLANDNMPIQFHEIDADKIEDELPHFSKLHHSSQQQQGRYSYFSNAATKNYFVDLIRHYAPKRQLRLFYLTIADNKVAFVLALYFNNIFYYWNIGYDTDFKSYSPSKILLYKLLELCFADQTTEFNFMRGDTLYKKKWTPVYRTNYQVRLLNPKGLAGFINKYRKIG